MLSIIIAFALCSSLWACGADAVIDDAVDQVSNVAQADNKNVLAVKGGTNSNYSGVTYGEAFEAFFGLPTWKYFKGTQEGPDDDGDGKPDYTEENIDVVEFTGTCTYQEVEVKALIQFTLDNENGIFNATYLSFNGVPQSSLMLSGLLSTVFETYMENNKVENNVSELETSNDENNSVEATNTADTEANDKNTDDTFLYDYETENYAGEYVGYSGYSISFSEYSSPEDDEIGIAEIYYDGELVSTQSVYICNDRGDWSDWDYDQFYVMYCDGYNEYLGFYETDGNQWVDYNGPEKNYDSLEMTEQYAP